MKSALVPALQHSYWTGRRVMVTGATGIVGSWLVKDLLSRGADVVVLIAEASPQSELYRSGDIGRVWAVSGRLEDFWALERAVSEYEVEVVFHLGAQTIVGTAYRSPILTFESNIRGTYNLLEACRVHADLVRYVVVASSDKAYGDQADLQYTEDMPLMGRAPYDVSKACADILTQSYHVTYGLRTAVARCGNVFGGGDLNWSRIVPGTIRSLLRGECPEIRSDGQYVRDYIYVKDVARAYLRLAEYLDNAGVQGEAFNFSRESPLTVLDLVTSIQRLMGCEHIKPRVVNTAKAEIRLQHLSAAKARSRLGWAPEYNLDAGLEETIAWYRTFLAG